MRKIFITLFIFSFAFTLHAQCDVSKRPIVFIHGFLASGDTYSLQIQRLIKNGYCNDRLFVFDWNSVTGNGKKTDSLLQDFINAVLLKTGASQVDLVGHSAGGGLGRGFLLDSVYAAKIAHYIHLGSRKWSYEFSWFKNNRCLNIYSASDKIIGTGAGNVEGAANLDLKDKDHYEVATSEETFSAIYEFLNNGEKPVSKNLKMPSIQIQGKAVELGSNEPMANAIVQIFITNIKTGERKTKKPVQTFIADEKGNWGPFKANPSLYYELALLPADSLARRISYYFEPFTTTDNHIYLRGFAQTGMMGMMLSSLPKKEDQSAIVVFSANKAMIGGRDSVTINGIPISTPQLTPAAKTIISSFIFDDGDGKTSGKALKQFSTAPFIGGVDISLPVNPVSKNTVYFNGSYLVLPSISSKQKIVLAVFK